MTRTQRKKLWENIVKLYFEKPKSTVPNCKLANWIYRLKFTDKGILQNKAYEKVNKHYPSLLRIYSNSIDIIDNKI